MVKHISTSSCCGKTAKGDCNISIEDCCLCEINGCIVQDCIDPNTMMPVVDQYECSTCAGDWCINIQNDSIYCDPNNPGSNNNQIENCTIIARLLSPTGDVVKEIRVFPGQKKSIIAKNVCALEIQGEQASFVNSCVDGAPNDVCVNIMPNSIQPTCNQVRGSYEGTVRMLANPPACNC
ncbi:hypothetical protein ACSVDA_02675 [Cytobacillus sp. Hm23]